MRRYVRRHAGGYRSDRIRIGTSRQGLDEILTRLDAERRALAERTDVTVAAADLNRLKELTDDLGDTINNPLAAILGGANRPATATSGDATNDAAARVRAAVRRINESLQVEPLMSSICCSA